MEFQSLGRREVIGRFDGGRITSDGGGFLKRVFGLVIDFGTSQSPKSTRPLTTYWCPSRPGHQALRNNFASSLLLRTWLPMTGRRVRRPTLFSLWRKARRENSAASRLLGSTSLRFALHGWQWLREVDQRIGLLDRLAACFTDHRNPESIEHSVRDLVAQRVYGLALPLIEWAPII
ncbi:transposase [Thiolapillus sp.]|uniref:transposase n=2 Tax=Thiolapillus sp. TaxID=2017437 RepID=UPI003AF77811